MRTEDNDVKEITSMATTLNEVKRAMHDLMCLGATISFTPIEKETSTERRFSITITVRGAKTRRIAIGVDSGIDVLRLIATTAFEMHIDLVEGKTHKYQKADDHS